MSNAKLFRRLVPALALVLAVTSSLVVAFPAQAAPPPARSHIPAAGPNTCYWAGYKSNSNNIVINGSTVGYYSVFLEHYTCNTSLNRAEGEIVINGSNVRCSSAGFWINLDANGVQIYSNQSSGTIGTYPGGCANGSTLDLATNSYQGSYTYCAEMTSPYFVINLSQLNAGSQCF